MPNVEWHVRLPNPKSPITFFNITIGNILAGRIKMELFADIAPTIVENFQAVLHRRVQVGKQSLTFVIFVKAGLPVGYKGCQFHRVIKGFMIQASDFTKEGPNPLHLLREQIMDIIQMVVSSLSPAQNVTGLTRIALFLGFGGRKFEHALKHGARHSLFVVIWDGLWTASGKMEIENGGLEV
ncbi:hypothetical protein L6164_025883 [Bauhinia variegata]|uniref:Uncharacterized protein n=1 Tax=Bauhinia variegata TaxID=167791 RepID=A0ACB9M1M3_BAUVA|nr:hypothetical protein L6164_025883 [Bauhinia variegata]